MRAPLLPGRIALGVLAAIPVAALLVGAVQWSLLAAWHFLVGAAAAALAWALADVVRSVIAWRVAPLQWERRLPTALARGVPHTVSCALVNTGRNDWWVELAEVADPTLEIRGLPLPLYVPAHSRIELHYTIVPSRRGTLRFARAELAVRTLHGSFRWRRRSGDAEAVRVYPDFTAIARHDALARAGRLAEIGIHAPRRRSAAAGDGCLWLLLDGGPSLQQRFDEALDALLLLAHVALQAGDAVGAMTIGAGPDDQRVVAPRRGTAALNTLITTLMDVQPHSAASDFPSAAAALMQGQRGRARIVVLTGVRDSGPSDLGAALRLLRTRHEVWLVGAGDPSPLGVALVNRYFGAAPVNRRVSASRR